MTRRGMPLLAAMAGGSRTYMKHVLEQQLNTIQPHHLGLRIGQVHGQNHTAMPAGCAGGFAALTLTPRASISAMTQQRAFLSYDCQLEPATLRSPITVDIIRYGHWRVMSEHTLLPKRSCPIYCATRQTLYRRTQTGPAVRGHTTTSTAIVASEAGTLCTLRTADPTASRAMFQCISSKGACVFHR